MSKPSTKNRNNLVIIISILTIGFIIFIYLYTEKQRIYNKNKAQKTQETQKVERAVNTLSSKYNAIQDWYNFIGNKTIDTLITIDIEDNLIRNGDRPVLIYANFEDITYNENQYIGHFIATIISRNHNNEHIVLNEFLLLLECTHKEKELLVKFHNPYKLGNKFAIIAKIGSLEKIKKKYDDREFTIVKANGKCLDLLYVGDNYDMLIWFYLN